MSAEELTKVNEKIDALEKKILVCQQNVDTCVFGSENWRVAAGLLASENAKMAALIARLPQVQAAATAATAQASSTSQALPTFYVVEGVIKFSKQRSGCRCSVYQLAENCHGKVRQDVEGDGIFYVDNSPHLSFRLAFVEMSQAEEFETQVRRVPLNYRKRPLAEIGSSTVLPDITVECSPVQEAVLDVALSRVWAEEYRKIEGDTDGSPDYDMYSQSTPLTSAVDINDETRLRLVEREDSWSLFRQKPEKCHLISQSKYREDRRNPNNIVFMSRNLHQQFDGIESSEGIPMFYLEYVSHDENSSMGVVNGKPCQVFETTVNVVFKDEEAASVLSRYFINYTVVSMTTIRIKLSFPSPMEFRMYTSQNAEVKIAQWASYDGVDA